MAWRHHDSDVADLLPDDDFSILDVRALAERVIDLRLVHLSLLFASGLAIGAVVPANFQAGLNITPPFSIGQPITDKTDHQLKVEVEDPKVIAARERKRAQAAAKRKRPTKEEMMVHLAPPATQEESNALTNEIALQKAWFNLARGAMAQIDMLEDRQKLVTARQDLEHNARLYTDAINRYKNLREEHTECGQKFIDLEGERNDLAAANKDQALRIQELDANMAMNDFDLAATERASADGARDCQKLVAQLSQT
nr:hypothetical protein [Tanacetum cinerariifolium]